MQCGIEHTLRTATVVLEVDGDLAGPQRAQYPDHRGLLCVHGFCCIVLDSAKLPDARESGMYRGAVVWVSFPGDLIQHKWPPKVQDFVRRGRVNILCSTDLDQRGQGLPPTSTTGFNFASQNGKTGAAHGRRVGTGAWQQVWWLAGIAG